MDHSNEPDKTREQREPRDSRTRRVLNVPLLVGTLVAAAVLAPAAYAWRAYQASRTASAFLERADSLEEKENWEEAANYLHRYLRLRPDETEVRMRLAQTYDKSAHEPAHKARAVNLYYQALGVASKDEEQFGLGEQFALRSRLTELLLELERFPSAEQEAEKLLGMEGHENDPEALRLRALALYGQMQSGAVVARSNEELAVGEALARALEHNPGDPELAAILASVYRNEPQLLADGQRSLGQQERAKLANDALDAMVAEAPENPQARLVRYRYRRRHGLSGAEEDLAAALKFGPDAEGGGNGESGEADSAESDETKAINYAVLLAAAENAGAKAQAVREEQGPADEVRRHYEAAFRFYERAIELEPSGQFAYVNLGRLHLAQGEVGKAVDTWEQGLEHCGDDRASRGAAITLYSQLAEVLVRQGRLDEAEDCLDELDRATSEFAPRLPRRARLDITRSNDLLRAKWLARKGKFREAIPLLKRVTTAPAGTESETAQASQAWLILGGAYAALNLWDQAAGAYEELVSLQPKSAQLRMLAAESWVRAGRPETAIRHYEQALTLTDSPAAWLGLARARFQTQLHRPEEKRAWKSVYSALAQADGKKDSLSQPWQVNLLWADYYRAGGKVVEESGQKPAPKPPTPRQLLNEAGKEHPESKELLQTLVLGYERIGASADADRVLGKLEELDPESLTTCMLRSRLHSLRDQYDEARKALEAGLATLPPNTYPALRLALFQLRLDQGQLQEAQQELAQLQKKYPSNVGMVVRLVELAVELRDAEEAERWERKLRELEGRDGTLWRFYRARRLLSLAKSAEDPRFLEAAELQAEIQSRRPAWARGYLLAGLVRERRGKYDEAIDAYEQAVRLGERRVTVYERLVALLLGLQRLDKAQQYLAQLQRQIPSSARLSGLEVSAAAQSGDLDRALDSARRGVETRPKDPMARIWLGQVLRMNGETEQAEEAIRKAVDLAPEDPRTHNALFTFYVQTDQPERAREALKTLAGRPTLSEAQQAFALAQGYELLGDREQAETKYREACRLAPESADIQRRLAAFVLKHDPENAEEELLRTLELAPEDGATRRTLASLRASRGGEENWREALKLLEQDGAGDDVSALDQRLQARLLARRGGKDNLQKARQMLETLVGNSANTAPGDRLLLAQLYEWEGRARLARQQFVTLVSRSDPDPSHLATYVDFLLRHTEVKKAEAEPEEAQADPRDVSRDLEEAGRTLGRLQELAPKSLDVIRLRARWLRAQDRAAEIEPLVDEFAENLLSEIERSPEGESGDDHAKRQAQICLRVGNVYSAVEQYEAAERWYRRVAELVPERYEPLALAVARQGRFDEAIALCKKPAEEDDTSRPATVIASVISATQPSSEAIEQAEPFLLDALKSHPNDNDLLLAMANVRVVQGRNEEAARLYEQTLPEDESDYERAHAVTLNNLATVLGELDGQSQKALKCIDRAIDFLGPKALLLDTKAMILVHAGKAEEAVALLEPAVSTLDSDPRFQFHLAVAYDRIGDAEKARNSLRMAQYANLGKQILTQTDRELLAELERKLGQQ